MAGPIVAGLMLAWRTAHAEGAGLIDENMLHPLDAFTAYTYEAGEFSFNQSVQTFPIPSWLWWGVTDWLSVEIDTLPLLGGVIVYGAPVPSFNARVRLWRGERMSLAAESMMQYLSHGHAQELTPHLRTSRRDLSWFGRLNASLALARRLSAHVSAGATFTEELVIESVDRARYQGKTLHDTWNPDVSVSLDWRPAEWISAHVTASYGTTFVYIDNVPRKAEVAYGVRIAPFHASSWAILRNFRAELPCFYFYFPDARESAALLLPLLPYFYWQWTFGA